MDLLRLSLGTITKCKVDCLLVLPVLDRVSFEDLVGRTSKVVHEGLQRSLKPVAVALDLFACCSLGVYGGFDVTDILKIGFGPSSAMSAVPCLGKYHSRVVLLYQHVHRQSGIPWRCPSKRPDTLC